ncbi:circularly permuted type 2 ATP-grasp protein [Ketogulonicigenium vulgare]|uniref:circularly permuted type 2 ATP-grasp protein n=1 Tax=Ketogulonicigenium vulgare TaxID=92945 RepID=UPI00235A3FBA|nr:circularly permuted type 2 ATP-grasp protein [Ketogulonicigenium vulgare]
MATPPKDLLRDYAPLPGVPDELMTDSGQIRPLWKKFLSHFQSLGADDLARRFARGDEYLRDAGVFFRQYGNNDSSERDWPLSHVPVLVDDAEWQDITAGLIQRADLLEQIVADLYGPAQLVSDGHLPAGLIAQSPEYLRPLIGMKPASGHFLNVIAFEIGRGPDGRWWVLSDRTQAPSGAGFALENRAATLRAFGEFFGEGKVHWLSAYFRALREMIADLAGGDAGRAAILTPGPLNDTYYEHAYIARHLGLMLLQGEDLTVEGDRVMVRTVSGPQPMSVLWRRVDAAWMDPLALNDTSQLGIPGLVEALRAGNIAVLNALGAGLVEMRALMAFMPRIAEVLTGGPLLIPNVATWWCGDRDARAHVLAHADKLSITPALFTRAAFDDDHGAEETGWMRAPVDAPLPDRLAIDGPLLVGQEAVTLSTTPAYIDGRLQPRPTALRVFLARTADGWQVMPGGYARIGMGGDPSALAMQRGGAVADVWVVSDTPVPRITMPPSRATGLRADMGLLPARAADNLFWLGRYIERAEGIMRLQRAWHLRLADDPEQISPLLSWLDDYLRGQGIDPDERVPEALHSVLSAAIGSAAKVRDRFSVDAWMALNDLARTARRMSGTVVPGTDEARAMGILLRKISGISGLVHENMYRFTGWRFLTIGRSLERAAAMAGQLAAMADAGAPDGALDLAIEVGDSTMTHRRRFSIDTSRATVVDLLGLDVLNPRAILYHLTALLDQIAQLPGVDARSDHADVWRGVTQLHGRLSVLTPEALDTEALLACRAEIWQLSDLLTAAFFR